MNHAILNLFGLLRIHKRYASHRVNLVKRIYRIFVYRNITQGFTMAPSTIIGFRHSDSYEWTTNYLNLFLNAEFI